MTPGVLRVRGLSARLGSRPILEGLDLPDLPAGRLVAVAGPNGSGKSTLLKSVAGLIRAHSDELRLGTVDLRGSDAAERAEHMRYLPQSLPPVLHMTVIEAVLVAIRVRRQLSTGEALALAQATLRAVGIAELGTRMLDELSGGQRQLVGLAQALCHEPAILLLDEPLASLDLNHQLHTMRLLVQLARERQLLIVLVVHDLNTVLRHADLAILLSAGRIVCQGPPRQVITPQSLAQTFSVRARIELCSRGLPHVLIDGLLSD